jgi:aryl-alcohol dehydrogenase-like predicted oxidoreductase
MKYNILGKTGLRVSQLGFGCGSIGGLLVRGDYPTMRQAVNSAIELGINYFDTAPQYGNGQSEVNLGAVLRELGADVLIGSKVRLQGEDMGQIGGAILRSVEGSLRRLGRTTLDLIQMHNHIAFQRQPEQDPDLIDRCVRRSRLVDSSRFKCRTICSTHRRVRWRRRLLHSRIMGSSSNKLCNRGWV